MLAEFIITFREALEAALVVGIILAYLEKTGNIRYNRHVYLGVVAGVLASILAAVLFQNLSGGFEGRTKEIFEGVLMLSAAVLVTWMILWVIRQERVRRVIEEKVQLQISGRKAAGLAFFTFASVFREGVETVIFVSAAAAEKSSGSMFGVLAGLSAAVVLAFVIFKTAVRVDVKRFFNVTSLVLIVFAAGIFAHGVRELQEAELLPQQNELWSTKHLLDDKSTVGGILRSLTGYNDNPTPLEVMAYLGYWGSILLARRKIGGTHR